jgi:ubiquinone/menaquinone biosynthesis C-methylase UbiE
MSRRNEHPYTRISDQFSALRKSNQVDPEVAAFAKLCPEGSSILSVGCGTALPNEKYLSDLGMHITGIDVTDEFLQQARITIPDATFIHADMVDLDQCIGVNQMFDGIVAWWSLFHLEPTEHEKVIRDLHRHLKVGGYMLFNHGVPKGEITGDMYGHEFYYSSPGLEAIQQLLDDLGFKICVWEVNQTGENNHMTACVQKT